MRKASTFSQVLLWFGAAISVAEIITGALLAPLGLIHGILAIIVGHIIGGLILFLAGFIGAESRISAAWSVRISFGKYGSFGFSILNILQLVGWTAIMSVNCAKALDGITEQLWAYGNQRMWCVIVGLFICIWILIGLKNLSKVNVAVMAALLFFSLILGVVVFRSIGRTENLVEESMTFGTAVEMNVAMALSWLPLISDYTRDVKEPFLGTLGSVFGYFSGSLLMFIIGLGAAIFAGSSDISAIMLSAGLGIIALIIVLLSTVTTTFLDVYSAAISAVNINEKIHEKTAAIICCVIGIIIAMLVSMDQYEAFLYLIGSVLPLYLLFCSWISIFSKRRILMLESQKLHLTL